MMLSQIQSFDAAFSGRAQDITAGSSGAGTPDPVWLNEVGAQFAAHSNGLSGEQRKANYGKVRSDASGRNAMTAADPHQK